MGPMNPAHTILIVMETIHNIWGDHNFFFSSSWHYSNISPSLLFWNLFPCGQETSFSRSYLAHGYAYSLLM